MNTTMKIICLYSSEEYSRVYVHICYDICIQIHELDICIMNIRYINIISNICMLEIVFVLQKYYSPWLSAYAAQKL